MYVCQVSTGIILGKKNHMIISVGIISFSLPSNEILHPMILNNIVYGTKESALRMHCTTLLLKYTARAILNQARRI